MNEAAAQRLNDGLAAAVAEHLDIHTVSLAD
ncbi:hypothetical protein GGE16_006027 [Rhizobium leguminosarum]|uniref:Uncharacterized protein n=1 Tax=Rhizobium leguminosarum TaxID=384 RepID=A0AAE2MRP8_RHILE|nr:hypothetical protein [Rhizobium leguminosarum]MBB4435962.1 hypothetical protein [Rhizobium esperanzae]MBB4300459.1 hypothetical protein [Rhizobium leguminosarum]MBB4311754.1 hypothetical protein [Rhizobium leguminosarum]MBB4420606.1 hypothetical protein [Rhizobium leguminosarum]